MTTFETARALQEEWQSNPVRGDNQFEEITRALVQAASGRVTITDWPEKPNDTPEIHYVSELGRSMLRAFVVCAISLVCSVLAIVALVLFAHSGWDDVHPWVSLMALLGSLGLLGIGLGVLLSARKRAENHLRHGR